MSQIQVDIKQSNVNNINNFLLKYISDDDVIDLWKPASLIGITVGLGLFGVLLTACIMYCHRIIKHKTKRLIFTANSNMNSGAQYEEIGETALHTMPLWNKSTDTLQR